MIPTLQTFPEGSNKSHCIKQEAWWLNAGSFRKKKKKKWTLSISIPLCLDKVSAPKFLKHIWSKGGGNCFKYLSVSKRMRLASKARSTELFGYFDSSYSSQMNKSDFASTSRKHILSRWASHLPLPYLYLSPASNSQGREGCFPSVVSDSVTPWTVACQAPLYIEFSRPDYWSG